MLVAGRCGDHAVQFRYGGLRRKVEFDEVEQRTFAEYLRLARVVSLANSDIELLRGSSEARRRYLDFIGIQIDPIYRPTLRSYERALRSRNALLKSPQARPREITAYDAPLLAHGRLLMSMRAAIVQRLAPFAAQAHREISGTDEILHIHSCREVDDFMRELERTRDRGNAVAPNCRRSAPRRDRTVGAGNGGNTIRFGGAAHAVALALKLAQARLCGRARSIATALVNRRYFWRGSIPAGETLSDAFACGISKIRYRDDAELAKK